MAKHNNFYVHESKLWQKIEKFDNIKIKILQIVMISPQRMNT